MSWAGFAAVLVAFFLTHSIPVRPAVKSRVTAVIGPLGFGVMYSLLSLVMLAVLIASAGDAPFVELWQQQSWHRHATHLGMLVVCLILAFAIARPNPFSFGGARNESYDPARPGLTRWSRHPILIALALWAATHLLPNGDLAHVILFGVLGAFAIAGPRLVDRRKRRLMGAARWRELDDARRAAPMVQAPVSWAHVMLRVLIALGVFVSLLLAHPYVIGVSAL